MKKNMSIGDRIIRLLLAIGLLYLALAGVVVGTLGIALGIVGGVFVLTSLVGFCPLYTLLGFKSGKDHT